MSEGKLPHFAKLRQEGAYAPLLSQKPLLSPVIWTTIATGKTPDRHRIGHFVAVNAAGEQLPVTSRMRQVKALWNILSDKNRSVARRRLVGDLAGGDRPRRGRLATTSLPLPDGRGRRDADGRSRHDVSRPSSRSASQPMRKRPQDVTPRGARSFRGRVAARSSRGRSTFEDDLAHFKWAYATAETYTRIGLDLWKEDRPDDLLVYIEGVDSTSHLFGHLFRAEDLSGELAEQQRKYGRAVEADVRLRRPAPRARVIDAMDPRHDARRPLGPRLRARQAPGRSLEDARHAPRQRDVSPHRGDPLPLRLPREAAHAASSADDPRRRADGPRPERSRARRRHAGARPARRRSTSPCPRRWRPTRPARRRRPQTAAARRRRPIPRSSRSSRASATSGQVPDRRPQPRRRRSSRPGATPRRRSVREARRGEPERQQPARELRRRARRARPVRRGARASSTRRSRSSLLNVEAYHNRAVIHERRRRARPRSATTRRRSATTRSTSPRAGARAPRTPRCPRRPGRRRRTPGCALAEEAAGAARRGDYAEADAQARRGRPHRAAAGARSTSTAPTSRT